MVHMIHLLPYMYVALWSDVLFHILMMSCLVRQCCFFLFFLVILISDNLRLPAFLEDILFGIWNYMKYVFIVIVFIIIFKLFFFFYEKNSAKLKKRVTFSHIKSYLLISINQVTASDTDLLVSETKTTISIVGGLHFLVSIILLERFLNIYIPFM